MGEEGGRLYPEACSKKRKPNQSITNIRSIRESIGIIRDKHFIAMSAIDPSYGFNQLPTIPTYPDIKVLQMPGSNNNFHAAIHFYCQMFIKQRAHVVKRLMDGSGMAKERNPTMLDCEPPDGVYFDRLQSL